MLVVLLRKMRRLAVVVGVKQILFIGLRYLCIGKAEKD